MKITQLRKYSSSKDFIIFIIRDLKTNYNQHDLKIIKIT